MTQPEYKRRPRLLRRFIPIPEDARAHADAARAEMRKSLEAMFPPSFEEHRRAAEREMLMAMRSLLSAAIDRLDRQVEKDKARRDV